jgi:hypothetical protein
LVRLSERNKPGKLLEEATVPHIEIVNSVALRRAEKALRSTGQQTSATVQN